MSDLMVFLIGVSFPFILLIFSFISFFLYFRYYKKMKLPISEFKKYEPPSFLFRIYFMFPKQFVLDRFNKVPGEFDEYGLHMFCGEQGSGKTTSVIEFLERMRKIYPKVKIRTNMNYLHQNGEINHWQDLVQNDNGIFGQIEVLDEIQNWFNSLQSKDFPMEMITEVSQQRKQRKMLVGTAQVFSRIAKPIREQTSFVYMPITIAGCLTVVRVSKPQYWNEEEQTFKKYIKTYFYVHTPEIRNAFDTYKKIEKYKNEGFKEDKLHLVNQ